MEPPHRFREEAAFIAMLRTKRDKKAVRAPWEEYMTFVVLTSLSALPPAGQAKSRKRPNKENADPADHAGESASFGAKKKQRSNDRKALEKQAQTARRASALKGGGGDESTLSKLLDEAGKTKEAKVEELLQESRTGQQAMLDALRGISAGLGALSESTRQNQVALGEVLQRLQPASMYGMPMHAMPLPRSPFHSPQQSHHQRSPQQQQAQLMQSNELAELATEAD